MKRSWLLFGLVAINGLMGCSISTADVPQAQVPPRIEPADGTVTPATDVLEDDGYVGPGDALPPDDDQPAPGTAAGIEPPPVTTPPPAVDTPPVNAPNAINTPVASDAPAAQVMTEDQETTDDAADFFYDDLSPYGQWVNVPDFGTCWQPTNVAPDWSPYLLGHWSYTDDDGWVWVSDESFGWATYHYGRWAMLPGGWCWVPGRHWGPAWVVWRRGEDVCGWAPCPPALHGHSVADAIAHLHPFAYTFCDNHFITDEHWRDHCEPITRNVTLLSITTNGAQIQRLHNHFIDRGPDVREIERVAGRPIERDRIVEAPDARSVHFGDHQIGIYRPHLPRGQTFQHGQPLPPSRFEPLPSHELSQAQIDALRGNREDYFMRLQTQMQDRQRQEMGRIRADQNRDQIVQRQQEEQRILRERHDARPTPSPQTVRRRASSPPPARQAPPQQRGR